MRWTVFAVLVLAAMPLCALANQTIPLSLEVVDGPCDVGITLSVDATEIRSGEQLTFTPNLTQRRKEFVIEYQAAWETGTIAKRPLNTTNTKPKTFTPKTTGTHTLILTARIVSLDCDDVDPRDNQAQTLVIVRGEPAPAVGPIPTTTAAQTRSANKTEVRPNGQDRHAHVTETTSRKRLALWLLVGAAGILAAVLVWKR